MESIIIEGPEQLEGRVRVSGAKNAALPVMASCLLTGGLHVLENVPKLKDLYTIKTIMAELGVDFRVEKGVIEVDSSNITGYEAPYELVKTMRASVLILGPLLARCGKARISLPGGCAIGARPIDLHLNALSAMGAEMSLEHGYINARSGRLKGADIFFDMPTVTGTENIMMAAVTAKGRTTLSNAAREPEVQDLADMLRSMGAEIEGDGTDTISIDGVEELKPARHKIIPDRIEAGTFMIAGAMTRGDVFIEGCRHEHLEALIEKMDSAGAVLDITETGIRVKGPERIESVDIKTLPFPGFPTDLQAQFMAFMCIARGWSMIRETVFENRFIHVSELERMGADIEINGGQALVRGKERLLSAPVMATDLRASASLVLAGLVAEGGITEIRRIYHLDRGYEDLTGKLQNLGARIYRKKNKN